MLALWRRNPLGPRYERQLIFMAEPTPHLKHPPRTPSRHSSFFAPDGRAETDSFHFETRGHCCAPIYMQFVAEGVVYVVCPVRPPHSATNVNYHLLGWRSIDRPLPIHNVMRRLGVHSWSDIIALFFTLQR